MIRVLAFFLSFSPCVADCPNKELKRFPRAKTASFFSLLVSSTNIRIRRSSFGFLSSGGKETARSRQQQQQLGLINSSFSVSRMDRSPEGANHHHRSGGKMTTEGYKKAATSMQTKAREEEKTD